ncbi:alpha,alpha-trehalose phosphorylase [Streptomyces sp. 1222.5]|uniref:glycoside hydrolase family 65 protein n=1 Tax=unclassified Streptomyces TaxID=2593676 RepID=UPI0008977FA1|nr:MULTISPECIES: glycosyl hydrolase family 65 protein [unclassified Streptomyces]PKW05555.1 alpha,alpha-trehalose phosphorylase [Streptomyces sp. 5112.2]SEC20650.1 alpha,alpha-trehalose phosphorylase [Streptomyces sp. 2231.1]SED35807.1 alpha,alpha-trehalose phosphorylase [Streptomyces sp. 1222.5]
MITHPSFTVEPWCLRETELNLEVLAQSESVFALSNGHIGWRGNLDEGEPHGLPGAYLNGVHERHPLPYAEAGYGYPESGQTMINVTDGKIIRLLVDDHPCDLRYGQLLEHERVLDFRTGVLSRTARWTSPGGRTVRITSRRLVSFAQRAVAAVVYEVEPVDGPASVAVQSELVANEQLPSITGDPRVAAATRSPLVGEEYFAQDTRLRLVHRTEASALRVGAAADHLVEGPGSTHWTAQCEPDVSRLTVTADLEPGQPLRLVKFVAYGWSGERSLPAVHDQVDGAVAAAVSTGWDGLVAAQRAYLDRFWAGADVEVEGDAQIQQAVRFALFHVLQAAARGENRAIPAKGLTGTGYDGHSFWDTESYVLPLLTFTAPEAVAPALRWRHGTLPAARERARQLGLAGAVFPWRTIEGAECSAYWPAGTAAFHVNADIANAAVRYVMASGDEEFDRDEGLDLLVDTARLWRSLGHHDAAGVFHIDGVTGPDEYSAIARDNLYTNLMARQNLVAAADAVARHPDRAAELGVDDEETAVWRDAAARMAMPYNETLGVHEQSAGYTHFQRWDFEATPPENYPLLLHYPYFDLYRKQVVKQADLVLAMMEFPNAFTEEQKARNFAYYDALTVRDSSLSACCQAVLAAETGHLRLAYAYLGEAALMDLDDLEHNTRDGLHIASLAGTWIALVAGFGGMRRHIGEDGRPNLLGFSPRLPEALSRVAFTVLMRGRRLKVDIGPTHVRYRLVEGEPLEVLHHGEPLTVTAGAPVERPVPPATVRPEPQQPRGRRPAGLATEEEQLRPETPE